MATEKVVEYYFPEDPKEEATVEKADKLEIMSMGGVTRTTADTMSESSEVTQMRQKFQHLDISSSELEIS